MHVNLVGLDMDLQKANPEMIREIIRGAETFLDSQLKAGIAADQRATTFSSIMAAVVAVLIGGLMTVISTATAAHLNEIATVIVPVIVGLLIALVFAFAAGRPTDWCYAGSNPRHWRDEVKAGESLIVALAGQAQLYADGIIRNRDVLADNARKMFWALGCAGLTLLAGVLLSIYVIAV